VTVSSSNAISQTARDIRGPAAVIPLAGEHPAKIIVDPPLPDALARGLSSSFSTEPKICASCKFLDRELSMYRRASGTFT
jgi:Family of unknown function (DUF6130)